MSNAFMGQRQQASPMGFGGFGGYQQPQPYSPFSGGYGGGMGGFPQQQFNPFSGGMGGFGTTFGGYGMGGGYDMGYGGSPLLPPPQPTVNDLFSQYFSSQYYGGPAFNPFAATSFFGGGFGGGFGFGGGGRRGRGGRMRPQPMPSPGQDAATIGAPPPRLSQLFAGEFGPMQYTGPQEQLMVSPAVQPPPEPLPYMGGFSFPFDQALPAKVEAPVAPAVQGVETIMPVPVRDIQVKAQPAVTPQPYAAPPPVTMPAKFAEPLAPALPSQMPASGGYETIMPVPQLPMPQPAPMFQPLPQPVSMAPGFGSAPPSPVYGNLPQFVEPAVLPQPFIPAPAPEPMMGSPFVRPGRDFFGGGFR